MELINVEEVFCKDCDFKDSCSTIICDVHNMPRVIVEDNNVIKCPHCGAEIRRF